MVTDKEDDSSNVIFERLVQFAEDKEAFDREVENIVEEFIMSQPEERREQLRRLHWRINRELDTYKNPQARLNRMIAMFYEQLREFQFALVNPNHPSLNRQPTEKAAVLEFKKKST